MKATSWNPRLADMLFRLWQCILQKDRSRNILLCCFTLYSWVRQNLLRHSRQPSLWTPTAHGRAPRGAIDSFVRKKQTPSFVEDFQNQWWAAVTYLGIFEDDQLFIGLDRCHFSMRITPPPMLKGTRFQDVPLHITLGHCTKRASFDKLVILVAGCHIFKLVKWSRRRESTTYLPTGTLKQLCDRCEELGFSPRGEWHISL